MSTAERFDNSRSQVPDDGQESPTSDPQSDQAELLRRAIRAVATARRLIAETEAAQRKHEVHRARLVAERDSRRSLQKDTELGHPPQAPPALLPPSLESPLASFVLAERALGAPPERMLVHLKAILSDTLDENDDRRENPELREAIVRWAIRAYFAEG